MFVGNRQQLLLTCLLSRHCVNTSENCIQFYVAVLWNPVFLLSFTVCSAVCNTKLGFGELKGWHPNCWLSTLCESRASCQSWREIFVIAQLFAYSCIAASMKDLWYLYYRFITFYNLTCCSVVWPILDHIVLGRLWYFNCGWRSSFNSILEFPFAGICCVLDKFQLDVKVEPKATSWTTSHCVISQFTIGLWHKIGFRTNSQISFLASKFTLVLWSTLFCCSLYNVRTTLVDQLT